MEIKILGHCPMGCGEYLTLEDEGLILCTAPDCPRPTAASDLLADSETEHIVQLTEFDFTLRHPLRERLDDELLECKLHEHLNSLSSAPATPGVYRANKRADGWDWIATTWKGMQ